MKFKGLLETDQQNDELLIACVIMFILYVSCIMAHLYAAKKYLGDLVDRRKRLAKYMHPKTYILLRFMVAGRVG